jgi:hypothetical protein
VKSVVLLLTCDIAPDAMPKGDVFQAPTVTEARRAAIAEGWRLGAVRDVCPACCAKGHRP